MSGILTIHTHTWFTLTARLCTFWCKNRERLYFNRVRIYIKNSGRSRGERGCTNMTKCFWSEWPHFLKVFFCVEVSQRLFHCRSSSSKRSSKSKEENREEDRIIYLELNFFFSLVLSVFSAVFSPSLFWHFTTIRTNKIITDAATVEKQKIQLQTQGCTGGMKDRKQHLKNWNKKNLFSVLCSKCSWSCWRCYSYFCPIRNKSSLIQTGFIMVGLFLLASCSWRTCALYCKEPSTSQSILPTGDQFSPDRLLVIKALINLSLPVIQSNSLSHSCCNQWI